MAKFKPQPRLRPRSIDEILDIDCDDSLGLAEEHATCATALDSIAAQLRQKGLRDDDVTSLWLMGVPTSSRLRYETLLRKYPSLKLLVIVDEGKTISRWFKIALGKQTTPSTCPQVKCIIDQDTCWTAYFVLYTELMHAQALDPGQALVFDATCDTESQSPSKRALKELLDGYGIESGNELARAIQRGDLDERDLQALQNWCLYLHNSHRHFASVCLAHPIHATTQSPELATLLALSWANLACPTLALRWLCCAPLDIGTRNALKEDLLKLQAQQASQILHTRRENIQKLADHDAYLAAELPKHSAPEDLHVAYTSEFVWVTPPRGSEDKAKSAILPIVFRIHDFHIEAQSRPSASFNEQIYHLDGIQNYHVVVGNPFALDALTNVLFDPISTLLPNWKKAITVLVQDPRDALILLDIDHPGVDLLFGGDVFFLWGKDSEQVLLNELDQNFARAIPHIFTGLSSTWETRIPAIIQRRQRYLQQYVQTVQRQRSSQQSNRALARLKQGKPLRVLIPTSRYSSVLQFVAKDLAEGFRSLGHEATVLIEKDQREWLNLPAWAETMERFGPDLVVLLDALRASVEPVIPDTMPSATWILDELPRLEEPSTIGKMSSSDLAFVWGQHLIAKYQDKLGYKHCKTLPFAVEPDLYQPNPNIKPIDRVAYITNVPKLSDPTDYPGFIDSFERNLRADGNSRVDASACEGLVLDLIKKMEWPVPNSSRLKTLAYLACQVARRLDRVEVALALVEAEVAVDLYGKGWNDIPKLAEYSRGSVNQGKDLCAIYQSHKVVLHINQNCNLHPRVLESISAGAFVVARKNGNQDAQPGGVCDYLELGRELCVYTNTKELEEICKRAFRDETWRQAFIERGRKRVLKEHRYAARAHTILQELIVVLSQNHQHFLLSEQINGVVTSALDPSRTGSSLRKSS